MFAQMLSAVLVTAASSTTFVSGATTVTEAIANSSDRS
jgi:hypothetical protein